MDTAKTLKLIDLTYQEKFTISEAIAGLPYSPEGSPEYIKAIRKMMWDKK